MRIVKRTILLLGLALAVAAAPLDACGPYGDLDPNTIKFPGIAQFGRLRGNQLLCSNDAGRIIVVDLKRRKTFDLGKQDGKRWFDGDVADGQAMMLAGDRLQVVALNGGKLVREIVVGTDPVWSYGFAGKGRAFVHRGLSVSILELATGKTLHTLKLGDDDSRRRFSAAWQLVGSRLYLPGPATTLCVIDVETGKLENRFAVDSRAGISALHVFGNEVYCLGSPSGWGARIDHVTVLDLETKKTRSFDLPRVVRRNGQFANAPFGTVYLTTGDRIDRFTEVGEHLSTFTTPNKEAVLAVWNYRAVVAGKDRIRLIEIKETQVTRK